MIFRRRGMELGWYGTVLVACISAQIIAAENPEDSTEAVEPAKPFKMQLYGLTATQVEELRAVVGIKKLVSTEKVTSFEWTPLERDAETKALKWRKGADTLYKYVAIRKKVGKTKWSHGGRSSPRAAAVIDRPEGAVAFLIAFDSQATGRNEMMKIHGFSQAVKDEIDHEMLRDVIGTKVEIKRVGRGYVIVSTARRGTFVVWKTSDQIFVRIDEVFDKGMVEAYVNRLGSTIAEDYAIDEKKWIKDEVVGRIKQLDRAYEMQKQGIKAAVEGYAVFTVNTFPELRKKAGIIRGHEGLGETWEWYDRARRFLWVNRDEFRYDDGVRGFVVGDNDQSGESDVVSFPDELQAHPRPVPEERADDQSVEHQDVGGAEDDNLEENDLGEGGTEEEAQGKSLPED